MTADQKNGAHSVSWGAFKVRARSLSETVSYAVFAVADPPRTVRDVTDGRHSDPFKAPRERVGAYREQQSDELTLAPVECTLFQPVETLQ